MFPSSIILLWLTHLQQAPTSVRTLFEEELRHLSKECAEVLRKLGRHVRNMEKCNPIMILDGVRSAVERLQHSLYLHSYLLVHPDSGILEENKSEEVPGRVIQEKMNGFGNHVSTFFQPDIIPSDASSRMFRRLYSCPPMQSDNLDVMKDPVFKQRVRVLESASALSLGTFATLLVEVAFRLEYVVEAVVELGELANFKELRNDRTQVSIIK